VTKWRGVVATKPETVTISDNVEPLS
jgi:hypothetical protein